MKKVYWRPPNVSRIGLVLVAVLSASVMTSVELLPETKKQRNYAEKVAAARLALECMKAIKTEKARLGLVSDPDIDPAETGMIGDNFTQVTSNTGLLSSKLTTTNPNWAAVVLDLMVKAGIGEGDVVAVGVSGSFPGLNVATYAAITTLKLRPIVVASVSSSEWGANDVEYLWLDMERTLKEARLVDFAAVGATYGGIDDVGIGLSEEGRNFIDDAIARNDVRKLDPASLADAIEQRMALYDELAGNAPIKAYINVGGGSASVGTHVGKKQFKPGLNLEAPLGAPDSVMMRFARRDVPVIHLARMKLIAESYGLPFAQRTAVPIGQGRVFVNNEYDWRLALGGLVAIIAVLLAFLRFDIGMRMLRGMRKRDRGDTPEPMV